MSDSSENSSSSITTEEQKPSQLTTLQLITSTLFAAFGIQNSINRERDFAKGKPINFIIAGIIFTCVFVLVIVLVVNIVLGSVQTD